MLKIDHLLRPLAKSIGSALLGASLALGAVGVLAEPAAPRDGSADISRRAHELAKADSERPQERFFALEALALLWSADHEEARNDASGFVRSARDQAKLYVERLERRGRERLDAAEHPGQAGTLALIGTQSYAGPGPVDVLRWQGEAMRTLSSSSARSDIEASLGVVLASSALECAAPELAQAYGFLAHARNALEDLGWRYADPYFRLSELRLSQAREKADACLVQKSPG